MIAMATAGPGDAPQGQIVAFGAAAGKDDLRGTRSQSTRHRGASRFQGRSCYAALPVNT